MSLHRSSTLYGTLFLTVTGLLGQGLAFVYRIVLSRLIGAEMMGLYQLIMPVYAVIMAVTSVGLTAAVANLTSEYQALGNHRAAHQVLRRCLGLFFLLLAVPAGVILLWSDPISAYVLGDARTQLGLLLLLPCIALTGIENLHKHAFYGAGAVRPPALSELLEQVVRTLLVLGLLVVFLPQYPEKTVGLIVLGMVGCEVVSAALLVALYRRYQRNRRGELLPSPLLNRRIGHIALPIALTALLGNLMGSVCAIVIPQKLVEGGMEVSQALTSFGVLFGMTMPLLALPCAFISALGLILVPKLAESTALGRREQQQRRISKAMLGTSVLMLPATALLIVLGPDLGVLLFKEPTVGNYLAPLAVATALTGYQTVLCCGLNGMGRQPTSARIALFCGGIELIMVYVTVGRPGVGLWGFVVASLITAVVGVVLSMAAVWRVSGLRPQIFHWLTAPGLSALLMGLVCNLLFHILMDYGLTHATAALSCLPFSVVLYLAALSAQGVSLRELFRV